VGSIRLKIALAAALALGLGGCLGYNGQVVHGYQLDAKTIDQVKPGASAEQILVLLGTPTTTSTVGGEAWYYITQVTDRSLQFMQRRSSTSASSRSIHQGEKGRPGRQLRHGRRQAFRFVSRTTPTAGAESTFLKGMFLNLLKFS